MIPEAAVESYPFLPGLKRVLFEDPNTLPIVGGISHRIVSGSPVLLTVVNMNVDSTEKTLIQVIRNLLASRGEDYDQARVVHLISAEDNLIRARLSLVGNSILAYNPYFVASFETRRGCWIVGALAPRTPGRFILVPFQEETLVARFAFLAGGLVAPNVWFRRTNSIVRSEHHYGEVLELIKPRQVSTYHGQRIQRIQVVRSARIKIRIITQHCVFHLRHGSGRTEYAVLSMLNGDRVPPAIRYRRYFPDHYGTMQVIV